MPPLPYPFDRCWSTADAIPLACLLEASAPKLGNVHPAAAFSDMQFSHFAGAAIALRNGFQNYASHPVGQIVLTAVQAMREQVGRNTSLGTILLLAPLAKGVMQEGTLESLQAAVGGELEGLTPDDSRQVYEAIRLAAPGGLGQRSTEDVAGDAPPNLVAAMRQVAGVDAVARQYATGFADIFERLLPWFNEELNRHADPLAAIVELQLRWLAHEPDGLIVRKLGMVVAGEVQRLAQQILASEGEQREAAVTALDRFLREDGHRRNPGTTADLIAATVFVRLILP